MSRHDFMFAVCAVILFVVALTMCTAQAMPIAEAQGDTVKVTLTDEPCALDAVSNLARRATWAERGKTFEGCYGIGQGLVVLYFSDKTVVTVPTNAFQRVTGL